MACLNDKVKLLFGKPDPILWIEDLVLRKSLDELRTIFHETMKGTLARTHTENGDPVEEIPELYELLRGIAREKFHSVLYE